MKARVDGTAQGEKSMQERMLANHLEPEGWETVVEYHPELRELHLDLQLRPEDPDWALPTVEAIARRVGRVFGADWEYAYAAEEEPFTDPQTGLQFRRIGLVYRSAWEVPYTRSRQLPE